MEEETLEAKYQLEDIEVQSVGLVPKGANMQEFFLLKNRKGAGMSKPTIDIEEVTTEETPDEVRGVLQQVADGIAGLFKTVEQSEPAEKAEPEGDDPEPQPDPEPEPAAADNGNLEKLLKAQTDRFEALLKQQKAEFDKEVSGLKTDLEKANERAEKAEQFADGQTEKAERQAMLQKALDYRAIPVKPNELGDLLYTLSKKLEGEEYEQVEAILKAADKQAWTAGLFKEAGTSRTPEEVDAEAKIEKMMADEGIEYKDALLKLSPAEQVELMGEEV